MGMGHGPCQSPRLTPTISEHNTLFSLMGIMAMGIILSRALYIIHMRTQAVAGISSGGWLAS